MGDWMGLAFASPFYCIGFGQYLAVFVPLPEVAFLNPIQLGALLAGVVFVGVNYIGAKETGDVETAIAAASDDFSLTIIGATERGLLSRIVRSSLAFETIERLETPVLMTERPTSRSLRERVFGRR